MEESEGPSSAQRASGLGEEASAGAGSHVNVTPQAAPPSVSTGPDAISEVLCTLSLEVNKSQEARSDGGNELENKVTPPVPVSKNVNVKDILRSLVNTPADGVPGEPALLPPACLGALGDLSMEQSVEFRSFDRYRVLFSPVSFHTFERESIIRSSV